MHCLYDAFKYARMYVCIHAHKCSYIHVCTYVSICIYVKWMHGMYICMYVWSQSDMPLRCVGFDPLSCTFRRQMTVYAFDGQTMHVNSTSRVVYKVRYMHTNVCMYLFMYGCMYVCMNLWMLIQAWSIVYSIYKWVIWKVILISFVYEWVCVCVCQFVWLV